MKSLRGEASEQQVRGWLTSPFLLDFSSASCTVAGNKMNISCRFGVAQGEKMRDSDDLRHSRAKLACSALTPIKLAPWGHVAELCRKASSSPFDWAFSKADDEAAYKQIPPLPEHSQLAAIALK